MAVTPTFPSREALRSFRFRPLDAVVGLGVFLLVYAVIRVGASARVPFHPGRSAVTISTAPAELPFYAARSLLRMFAAHVELHVLPAEPPGAEPPSRRRGRR
jgi:NitT/TauT family transport system permease protein